jgi:hypothetical protein
MLVDYVLKWLLIQIKPLTANALLTELECYRDGDSLLRMKVLARAHKKTDVLAANPGEFHRCLYHEDWDLGISKAHCGTMPSRKEVSKKT